MKFIKQLKDKVQGSKEVIDFHGAAIIDRNGHELPITEEMVQDACSNLENDWFFPLTSQPQQSHGH